MIFLTSLIDCQDPLCKLKHVLYAYCDKAVHLIAHRDRLPYWRSRCGIRLPFKDQRSREAHGFVRHVLMLHALTGSEGLCSPSPRRAPDLASASASDRRFPPQCLRHCIRRFPSNCFRYASNPLQAEDFEGRSTREDAFNHLFFANFWSGRGVSNPRPQPWEG
jgi:hypothetical protein